MNVPKAVKNFSHKLSQSLQKSEIQILVACLTYLVVGVWLLQSFPIAFDEAKAFLVAKKVALGRDVGINIHGGSNSSLFYSFYSTVIQLFGADISVARTCNIIIHSISIAFFWITLKRNILQSKNAGIALTFFLFAFMLNPFTLAYTIPVNHFSLSLSFLIMSAAATIEFFFDKKASLKKMQVLCIAMAFFTTLTLYIRPHMFPLIIIPLLATVHISKRDFRLRLLSLFICTIVTLCLVLDFYLLKSIITGEQVDINVAKFLITHRLTPLINLLDVYLYDFKAARGFLQKLSSLLTYPRQLNDLPRDPLIQPISHLYIFKSFILQAIGLHVSTIFLFTFSIYGFCFWKKFQPSPEQKTFLFTVIISIPILSIPLYLLRYLESTSFSYFYQAFFLLSVGAVVILSILSNKQETKLASFTISSFFVLLCLQNILFLKPQRNLDNPFKFVFGSNSKLNSSNKYSIKALKESAQVINSFLKNDELVLLGHYAIAPYLKGKTISGLEMNIYRKFFSKKNFLALDKASTINPMGASANLIYRKLLQNQKVAVVVEDGSIHKDLINNLKEEGLYKQVLSLSYGNILVPNIPRNKDITQNKSTQL